MGNIIEHVQIWQRGKIDSHLMRASPPSPVQQLGFFSKHLRREEDINIVSIPTLNLCSKV